MRLHPKRRRTRYPRRRPIWARLLEEEDELLALVGPGDEKPAD